MFGTTRLGVSAALGNLKDPPPDAAVKFDLIEKQVAEVRETILSRRSKGPEVVNARSPFDRTPIVTDIDYETADAETEVFADEEPFDFKKDALLDGSAWKSTGEAYKAFRIKETGDPEGAVLDPYEGLLIAELYQPEALNIIRQHEAYRTGKTISDGYSEEAIVKDFLIFQRYLEDLNLQTTAYHMKRTMTGSDRQANSFAKGQLLFEYLGSAFQSQNSSQEKRDAIANHFWGTMSSAENVFTLGSSIAVKNAGIKTLAKKLAAPRVLRTYRTLFKQAKLKYNSALSLVENVSKAEIPDAAKKGLIESAEKAKRILERNIFKNITNSQVINKTKSFWNKAGSTLPNAVRSIENKAIWSAAAIDGTGAMFTDWLGQKTRQFHDPDREYVPLQTIAMFSVGLAGGGIALATNLFGKASNKIKHRKGPKVTDLQDTKRKLGNYIFNEYLEHVARIEGRAAKQNVSEVVDPSNATKWAGAEATLQLNKIKFTSFYAKAKKGAPLRYTKEGMPIDLEETINFTWLFGNEQAGVKGVVDILESYNIKYEGRRIGLKDSKGDPIKDNFANWFLDVLKALPAPVKKQIEETYDATLKKSVERYSDKSLTEAYTMIASEIRSAGTVLGQQGYLAKIMGGTTSSNAIEAQLKEFIGPLQKTNYERFMSDVNYAQNTVIRSMITHPGTTGLNLIGWRFATSVQTTADVVRLMMYGGEDVLSHLKKINELPFNKVGADTTFNWHNKTRALAEGVKHKATAIMNPVKTINEFEDALAMFPKETSDMSKYIFGGISERSEIQKLNDVGFIFTPNGRKVIDNTMDAFQRLSMVRIFDTYSKAIEFKKMMHQLTEAKYGVDYYDFIKTPKFAEEVANGKFSINVVVPAADSASRLTFAKRFGDVKPFSELRNQPVINTVKSIAKLIEGARNVPLGGVQVPFGQFFNNLFVTAMDYSGVSLAHHMFMKATGRGEQLEREVGDVAAKSGVAMVLMLYMGYKHVKDLEDGLSWTQGRGADGQIYDKTYNAPQILLEGPARMIAHAYKGEILPDEDYSEIRKAFEMYLSNPDNKDKWDRGEIPEDLIRDISRTIGVTSLTRTLEGSLDLFIRNFYDRITSEDIDFREDFSNSFQAIGSNVFGIPLRMVEPVDETLENLFGEGKDFIIKDKKIGNEYFKKITGYVDFSANQFLELGGIDSKDFTSTIKYDASSITGTNISLISSPKRPMPPPSAIAKMMVLLGIPTYKINQSGLFREANNRLNSLMPDEVNRLAQANLESLEWKNSTLIDKKNIWRDIVREARSNVKKTLVTSLLNKAPEVDLEDGRLGRLLKLDSLVGSNRKVLAYYLKDTGFLNDDNEIVKDATELDAPQLHLLIERIKQDTAARNTDVITAKDLAGFK